MSNDEHVIVKTKRLVIRKATIEDAPIYYKLWTNPDVMTFVGFPQGLPITQEEIEDRIRNQCNEAFLDQRLIVVLGVTGEAIGECTMHTPDEKGLAETDVKLLPTYWGHKYGIEIKQALLFILFTKTDCMVVQATPNVKNIASIKMQEAVGGVRMGKGIFEFPEKMKEYTTPVHHYIYHVHREDWERVVRVETAVLQAVQQK